MRHDLEPEDTNIARIRQNELDLLKEAIKTSIYPTSDDDNILVADARKRPSLRPDDPQLQQKVPQIAPPKPIVSVADKTLAERWVNVCESLGIANLGLCVEGVCFRPSRLKPTNLSMVQISYELNDEERNFVVLCNDVEVYFIDATVEPHKYHRVIHLAG